VTARIDRESTSQEGVILAWGRRAAGFAFAVVDNRLVLDYNLAGDHALVTGPLLAAGQLEIQLRMRHEGRGRGFAELLVDGEVVAGQRLRTITGGFGPMSTQVGHSGPSAVSSLYEPPFAFPGRLSNVEVRLAPHDIRGGEVDSGELRID
jgi:arylsulfatase